MSICLFSSKSAPFIHSICTCCMKHIASRPVICLERGQVTQHSCCSTGSAQATAGRHRVFVYGTLKQGEPNHHVLSVSDTGTTGQAAFVAPGTTTRPYPLIIASRYNIPFLLDHQGRGQCVRGEIYDVDDRKLVALDELESHPTFYVRRKENIRLNDDTLTECWTYFLPKFRPELLDYEAYESYSASGPHGKVYIARYLRDNYSPVQYILGKSDQA